MLFRNNIMRPATVAQLERAARTVYEAPIDDKDIPASVDLENRVSLSRWKKCKTMFVIQPSAHQVSQFCFANVAIDHH